jgi:hypothetical protein
MAKDAKRELRFDAQKVGEQQQTLDNAQMMHLVAMGKLCSNCLQFQKKI